MVVPVNPMLLGDEVGHIASDSWARVAFVAEELAAHVVPAGLDHVVLIRYRDCTGAGTTGARRR